MEQTLPEGPIKLGANGMRRLVLGIVFAALVDVISDEGNFAGAHISRIDGVRVDFADRWAHIEPAEDSEDLHLRLEGDDVECCNRLSTLLVNILERNHPDLALLLRDALATTN